MDIQITNMKNEAVETMPLPESIASASPNEPLVYELVRQYQAGGRQGTVATKNRALVSGSGRKLWRQKGTGRARIGSVRSPLWRHGGTVFGPQPRNFAYRISSKKKIAGMRAALAQKIKDGSLFVIDQLLFDQPKTKAAIQFLKSLNLDTPTLFVDSLKNQNLQLSVRNLENAKFSGLAALNIVDVLKYRNLVISKEAFNQLTKILEQ